MYKENQLVKDEKHNIEYFNSNCDYGSHDMWDRNDQAFHNSSSQKYDQQCCICNKGMNTFTGSGYMTRGYTNPLMLVAEKDHNYLETELSGCDMGTYFVGSECGKKIKKALKEANLDWKQYIYYFTRKK